MIGRGIQKWIAMVNSAGEKFTALCTSNGYDIETVKGWISGKSAPSAEDVEKINSLIFALTGKKPDIADFQPVLASAEKSAENSVSNENKKGAENAEIKPPKTEPKEKPDKSPIKEQHIVKKPEVTEPSKSFMPEPIIEDSKKEENKMEQMTQQTVQAAEQPKANQEPRKTRTPKHRTETNIGTCVDAIQQELAAMQDKLQGKLDTIRTLSNGLVVPDRLKEMVELANNVSNDDLKLIVSMLKKLQPVK